MTATIDALPTTPSRSMTDVDFVTAMDNFLAAFPEFRLQANALAQAVETDATLVEAAVPAVATNAALAQTAATNAAAAAATAAQVPVTPATSGSNVTIASSGTVNFTLNETGKAFAVGQIVKCTTTADVTRYIIGVISSFAGTSMQVTCQASGGSGSSTSWAIALIPPLANSFAGGTDITGSNKQNVQALLALDIDLTAADMFTKGISVNSTFTLSGATAGKGQIVILELTISSAAVPTWPAGGSWGGSTIPTLGNGRHGIALITFNGFSSWTGVVLYKAAG